MSPGLGIPGPSDHSHVPVRFCFQQCGPRTLLPRTSWGYWKPHSSHLRKGEEPRSLHPSQAALS